MILAQKPLLLVIETSFNTARHRSDAIVIVVVGCVIAAIAPFDTAFAYLSNGSALARVCLFGVIGTCGVFCAEKSGLQVRPSGLRCPTLTPISISVAVTPAN
jgi:hypothetical protein